MVKVGRDLWRSFSPLLLLRQGNLELVAQDHEQIFTYFQGERFYYLSGEPVPVPDHPHCEIVFPDVQMTSPVFHFVPIALVLTLGTAESLASFSLHASFRLFF